MDVSIIIVNYKTACLISECVSSIIDKTRGIEYEVIIVDNFSEPDFEIIIKKSITNELSHKFHFISLPNNLGFGLGNNEGLKIAKGRNILFLNPDTILVNNAIKILCDFIDSHPNIGACGANMHDIDLKPTNSFWRLFPGPKWDLNALFGYLPSKIAYGKNWTYNHTGNPLKVAFVIGADLMIKKTTLDQIGSFSKDFFMFFEETDLQKRIHNSGKDIYSVPDAKIIHLEGASFTKTGEYPSDQRILINEKSRSIFLNKHYNKISVFFTNIFYRIFLNLKIITDRNPAGKIFYKKKLKLLKTPNE